MAGNRMKNIHKQDIHAERKQVLSKDWHAGPSTTELKRKFDAVMLSVHYTGCNKHGMSTLLLGLLVGSQTFGLNIIHIVATTTFFQTEHNCFDTVRQITSSFLMASSRSWRRSRSTSCSIWSTSRVWEYLKFKERKENRNSKVMFVYPCTQRNTLPCPEAEGRICACIVKTTHTCFINHLKSSKNTLCHLPTCSENVSHHCRIRMYKRHYVVCHQELLHINEKKM